MKKIYATLLFFSLLAPAFGQILKKTFVTGSLNAYTFDRTNQNSSSSNEAYISFSFNPSIGFMQSNTLAFGLMGSYSYSEIPYMLQGEDGYNFPSNSHIYGLGPFMRNFFPINDQAFFFSQTSAMYVTSNYKKNVGSSFFVNGQLRGIKASLSPGFLYLPSPSIGIEVNISGLSYQRYSNESGSNETVSNWFGADFGLSNIGLGLTFYIGKEEE